MLAFAPQVDAQADYDPRAYPIFPLVPGPSGAYVQNQGSVLNINDTVGAWNGWIADPTWLKYGSNGCGVTVKCIIFGNETADLTYTDCSFRQLSDSSPWVLAQVDMVSGNNAWNSLAVWDDDCLDYGSTSKPYWTVSVNTSAAPPAGARQWLQRHEAGHAVGLWHAHDGQNYSGCWAEDWFLFPVMHASSSCGPPEWYGLHYNSSDNEKEAVLQYNCLNPPWTC